MTFIQKKKKKKPFKVQNQHIGFIRVVNHLAAAQQAFVFKYLLETIQLAHLQNNENTVQSPNSS